MKFILQPIVGDEHPVFPDYKFEKITGDRSELFDAITGSMEFGISRQEVERDLLYRTISTYIVRGEDKRVIGTCVLANDSGHLSVDYLWVATPYRRQHIGQNLVNLAILRSIKNSYYDLCTRVREDRGPAIALFKKLGFVQEPEKIRTPEPTQERLIP